jgi:hypothetical protein
MRNAVQMRNAVGRKEWSREEAAVTYLTGRKFTGLSLATPIVARAVSIGCARAAEFECKLPRTQPATHPVNVRLCCNPQALARSIWTM